MFNKIPQPNLQFNSERSLAILLGVVILSLGLVFITLAWTDPTEEPPGGNVSAPINVSGTAQVKEGRLGIGTAGGTDSGYDVSIGGDGIHDGAKVAGTGYFEDEICLGSDTNCITDWPSGGGGNQDLSSSRSGDTVYINITDGSNTSFTDNYEANTNDIDYVDNAYFDNTNDNLELERTDNVTVSADLSPLDNRYVQDLPGAGYGLYYDGANDLNVRAGTGISSSADEITFDCSEVAGTNLSCSGETLNASGGGTDD